MTMKTFDPTKPVQTRDGRDARIVAVDYACSGETIVAAVRMTSGEERLRTFNTDGRYFNDMEETSDLVNITIKKTGWTVLSKNFYVDNVDVSTPRLFESEQEAHDWIGRYSGRRSLFVARVEWEE